jgi:hypothetical protein
MVAAWMASREVMALYAFSNSRALPVSWRVTKRSVFLSF